MVSSSKDIAKGAHGCGKAGWVGAFPRCLVVSDPGRPRGSAHHVRKPKAAAERDVGGSRADSRRDSRQGGICSLARGGGASIRPFHIRLGGFGGGGRLGGGHGAANGGGAQRGGVEEREPTGGGSQEEPRRTSRMTDALDDPPPMEK